MSSIIYDITVDISCTDQWFPVKALPGEDPVLVTKLLIVVNDTILCPPSAKSLADLSTMS